MTEPGSHQNCHTSKHSIAQHAQHSVAYPSFKLLALIVDLAQACEVGLGLVLEERVMQHLVVDVQLAHFGLHAVPLLLLQLLVLLLLLHKAGGGGVCKLCLGMDSDIPSVDMKFGMTSALRLQAASASCSPPSPARGRGGGGQKGVVCISQDETRSIKRETKPGGGKGGWSRLHVVRQGCSQGQIEMSGRPQL